MDGGTRSGRFPIWLPIIAVGIAALGIFVAVRLDHLTSQSRTYVPAGTPITRADPAGTVQGVARRVEIAGRMTVASLRIDTGDRGWTLTSGGETRNGSGGLEVGGGDIVVDLFRTRITPGEVVLGMRDERIALPASATVNGEPVQAGSQLVLLEATSFGTVHWLDAPDVMRLDAVDEFSWAGEGEIVVSDQHLSGDHLGALGALQMTVTRTDASIALSGQGVIEQVFVDGYPALGTTARVHGGGTHITVTAGNAEDSAVVAWAPQNTGPFGMCVLKATPRSDAARWINLGLQYMPPMFGGEPHDKIGGDTTGMADGDALPSFIHVGDAERSMLSINVPAGTAPGDYTATVLVEGNFDPIEFSVTVTVLR